jgi:hypothetical protein
MGYLWIKQFLESVYLLENSINIDVMILRHNITLDLANRLNRVKSSPYYKSYIKDGTYKYKELYPDRSLTRLQEKLLLYHELAFDNDLYADLLVQSFKRYCDRNETEIISLKTAAAKSKRKTKIAETANKYANELFKIKRKSHCDGLAKEVTRFEMKLTFVYPEEKQGRALTVNDRYELTNTAGQTRLIDILQKK